MSDPAPSPDFESACHQLYMNMVKPAVGYSSEQIIKDQFGEVAVNAIRAWKQSYEATRIV